MLKEARSVNRGPSQHDTALLLVMAWLWVPQVHLHGEHLEAVREVAEDVVLVQWDNGGQHRLQVRAVMQRAEVSLEGDLLFGLVPTEGSSQRRLRLVNRGAKSEPFRFDWDK
jgi:hypothetical protein